MATIYGIAKRIYHGLVPVRHRGPLHNEKTWLGRTFTRMQKRLEHFGTHDELYDHDYYTRIVDGGAVRSAATMAQTVISQFSPKSVIDVGCGTGAFLLAFKENGMEAFGVDGSQAALDICHGRGLDVERLDLEKNDSLGRTSDVVTTVEVAEHLPESCADRFVSILTNTAPVVVFTAATPGQGGNDHINEQPNSYWIEKFKSRNYEYLSDLTDKWRADWKKAGVEHCYAKNVMVFRRRSNA